MTSQGPHQTSPTPLTGRKFSTNAFRQHEQFDAWCDFTATMCDLRSVASPRSGFRAAAESYQLGSMLLTSFELSPMTFTYTKEIIRKSSFDHWCISAVTRGTVASESHDRGFRAAAGGTVLHSYAIPFSGLMDVTDYSGIFLSRDTFWDIADELDRASHQQVVGPMSHIVADFIVSLRNRAHKLTVEDGAAVSEAFGHLLRAMVRKTPSALEEARAPIAAAQFERVRRFIMQNLKSPHLTPASICAQLGLSRRQLYYLFERHGGVAKFIRDRRLAACHHALSRRPQRRLVSTVAYEFGFTNLSSFSRQFQQRYGFSPSEARFAWLSVNDPASQDGGTLVDWLLGVDCP